MRKSIRSYGRLKPAQIRLRGIPVPADLPTNENNRLAALKRYDVLDSPPENNFDRIASEVQKAFEVPICLISLIDEDRQFFKSKIGLDVNETSRSMSFCAYGLLQDEPLIVPDATADLRFADNPLVIAHPKIRFYAGAQLRTPDGFTLGNLCVADTVARPAPSPEEIAMLQSLADEVIDLLEMRKDQLEARRLRHDLERVRKVQSADRKRWQRMEQTAALALDAGRLGFWEWDQHGKVGQWSERMFLLMGMASETVAPSLDEWIQMVHPADRKALRTQISMARHLQEPFTMKFRVQTSESEDRSVTIVGDHFLDERGETQGALGVAWDSSVADRKERALAESEEMFRGLSLASPVGIFKTDLEGNITFVNPRMAEIWGVTNLFELHGNSWINRVHPEDRQALLDARRIAIEENRDISCEYRLLLPNGTVRWVHGKGTFVHGPKGEPTSRVGTIDDVTEQKMTLEELRVAKRVAEGANRSKDIFLTNVSHELRTPLNGVLGMTELLLDTELTDDQRQMTEIVQDSGHALLRVVSDILDLSRVEACRLTIQSTPFNWNEMLRQAIAQLKPEADRKNIAITIEQPDDTPGQFIGDADRIKQILLVYLTNALKFTPTGSVTVRVNTKPLGGRDCELLVMVQDAGPGIPVEQQPKLFQPFSQIDESHTRKHGGAGLGLAIAKRLAELMGGSVGVISATGKGAAFWLRLQLSVPADCPAPAKRVSSGLLSENGRRLVLLVEDSLDGQRIALNMLWKLDCQVDLVSDGLTALEMMRRNEYAVVFMDCQLPQMDGYRATQEIREWERRANRTQIPIVALTAHVMAKDRERGLDSGMNDYLSKPVDLEALRCVLDRWAAKACGVDQRRC